MTDEMEEQRGFFFLPRCLANTCITRCGFQQWPHLFALCHFCSYFKELFGISTELHFPSLLSKDLLTWNNSRSSACITFRTKTLIWTSYFRRAFSLQFSSLKNWKRQLFFFVLRTRRWNLVALKRPATSTWLLHWVDKV